MERFETIIIGAGASGIFAALRFGEEGRRNILLIEGNDRVGRKLSATGNGQGNVTNTDMDLRHYRSGDKGIVSSVLNKFSREALLRYMRSLGGIFEADEEGRVYPASRQASSVTDLLRFRMDTLGIRVRLGEKVVSARKKGEVFFVNTDRGEYSSRYLILANGGKASAYFGSDGSGYALARSFGHTVTPLYPSLVQLKTETSPIRGLKGVRCNCRVRLLKDDRTVCDACGDVIFTDYGVSGNAVFKLSPRAREGDCLSIDFLPETDESELIETLENKIEKCPTIAAGDLFRCIANSMVGKCILRRCGIDGSVLGEDVRAQFNKLAHLAKNYTLKIIGTLGFDSAQVTQGGVSASELHEDLMSKKIDGLYIVGELTDVDGDCGGYNLQWAFSSGWVAAGAICERLRNEDR